MGTLMYNDNNYSGGGGVEIDDTTTSQDKVWSSDKTADEIANNAYTLPIANSSELGGVKIGSGLNINSNGVVSVSYGDCVILDSYVGDATISSGTSSGSRIITIENLPQYSEIIVQAGMYRGTWEQSWGMDEFMRGYMVAQMILFPKFAIADGGFSASGRGITLEISHSGDTTYYDATINRVYAKLSSYNYNLSMGGNSTWVNLLNGERINLTSSSFGVRVIGIKK